MMYTHDMSKTHDIHSFFCLKHLWLAIDGIDRKNMAGARMLKSFLIHRIYVEFIANLLMAGFDHHGNFDLQFAMND